MADSFADITGPFDHGQVKLKLIDNLDGTYSIAASLTGGKTQITDPDGDIAQVITGANTGVKGLRVYGGPTDPISDIPVGIDFPHHQIHEGESHQVVYPLTAVSLNANMDFRIVVPADIYPHFQVEFDCLAQTTFSLYESPTISGGNLQTAYNRNRNSLTVPATTIYYGPTVTATGTKLLDQQTIGDGTAGGRGNAVDEWILKGGLSYLVRFTANAASNSISVRMKFYEDLGV